MVSIGTTTKGRSMMNAILSLALLGAAYGFVMSLALS
jgi:hypothetical protein